MSTLPNVQKESITSSSSPIHLSGVSEEKPLRVTLLMLLEYFSTQLLLIRLHALGIASSSELFCIGLQLYQLAISQGNCTEVYCYTQLT